MLWAGSCGPRKTLATARLIVEAWILSLCARKERIERLGRPPVEFARATCRAACPAKQNQMANKAASQPSKTHKPLNARLVMRSCGPKCAHICAHSINRARRTSCGGRLSAHPAIAKGRLWIALCTPGVGCNQRGPLRRPSGPLSAEISPGRRPGHQRSGTTGLEFKHGTLDI